jgi:hypothetical protein
MTRDEYIDMRKAEAWRRAKAALTEVWEWDGQRTGTSRSSEVLRYEEVKERVDTFIREFEDDGMGE